MAVKTIILLGADGDELARHDVAVLSNEQAPVPPPLPKTLDWYRDITKWLVATSAASLVLGLGYFGEASERLLKIAFTLSGALLIVALGAGVLAHLLAVEFGKLWENRSNISSSDEETARHYEEAQADTLKWLRRSYFILLGFFFAGMLLLTCTFGARVWLSSSQRTLEAMSWNRSEAVLMTDPATGEIWTLSAEPGGGYVWELKAPPLPEK